MHDFSTVDGFMDVNDCVVEMIQRIANEPSVGLFYIQQHTQNAVPNLIRTKDRVVEKSKEVALHTADLEDSITIVRSMKDFGVPIADQMTKDIQKSLIMLSSVKLQKRPFLNRLTSEGESSSSRRGLRMARSGSWGGSMFGSSSLSTRAKETGNWDDGSPSTSEPSQLTESKGSSKLSTMLNSAKQKASVLNWLQRDASGSHSLNSKFSGSIGATPPPMDIQADDAPLSRHKSHQSEMIEHYEPASTGDSSVESYTDDPSEIMESYEKFKSDREAKLEEWLKETDNDGHHSY
ncbi:unnamed protein product [Victoria cruziana]